MGDSPYGMTLYVPNSGGTPPLLSQQTITDLLGWGGSSAGTWLRYQLKWISIEQTPGVYTWNVLDDAVAKCNANGINMCWNMQSPPIFRQTVDPATGNITGTTTTSGAITAGVAITSIPVNALPTSTNLVNGSTLTVDATGAHPETVVVNHTGGYAAGATSITINSWTPAFAHASGSWVVSTLAWLPNGPDSATFMAAVAARYNGTAGHGTIPAMQVGNEDWDTKGPRDLQSQWLVPVVNACYPAIKAVYPGCRVGVCSVRKTPTNAIGHITNWVTNLYTYGGGIGSNADWLDFHYYRSQIAPGPDPTSQDANTPSVATELSTIKSVAASFGHTPEIWNGETGWDTYDDGTCTNPVMDVTQDQQSTYIQAMFDALRTGGGSKCFPYTMDPGAQVKPLANCSVATVFSSSPKSLTQKINGVYTYLPAYTGVQNYQKQYPTWNPPQPPNTNTDEGTDTFASGGRGSPNAWSPASDTESWAQVAGASTLSFTGTQGQLTGTNAFNVLLLGSKKFYNSELACRMSHSNIQDRSALIARATSSTTYYYAEYANGSLNIQMSLSNSVSTLATMTFPEVAGTQYWVRFKVQGFGTWTPNLFAKVWVVGTQEPTWMLSASDSSITAAGQFGVRAKGFANASILLFDTFTCGTPNNPPPNPANNTGGIDLPYGSSYAVPGNSGSPALISQQIISDVQAWGNGGAWLRYQIQWLSIEQVQGTYLWSVLDDAVARCNIAGVNICLCIQGAPSFRLTVSATTGGTGTDLPSASDVATFASLMATRYNGNTGHGIVQGIQIGNEDWDKLSPRDSQSQWLVPVINAAYPAIRAAHPSCYILACAVTNTTTLTLTHVQNWMRNLWTYGGGIGPTIAGDPKFVLDFHYYRDGAAAGMDPTTQDANTPSIATELAAIQAMAAVYGYSPPVWCTETGWNAYDNGTCQAITAYVTQDQQSQYILAVFDALRNGGAKKCFVFTLNANAQVNALAACGTATVFSTVTKSIVQTISTVYTYLTAYNSILNYEQLYPTWVPQVPLPTTTPNLTAIGRRGTMLAIARRA